MNLIVLLKMVPDVVEELEIAEDGKSLDFEWIRMILSEWCDHALEEALLLKEQHGGRVTAVVQDGPEVDDVLYTALAKGADSAVKLTGAQDVAGSHEIARLFQAYLSATGAPLDAGTLILTGSQAIDDLSGEAGAFLAQRLDLPYLGVVTGVSVDEATGIATVRKEFSGGVRGEFQVRLPAVLGIQAAEKPPRYVPVAKVRAAMKEGRIEEAEVSRPEQVPGLVVKGLAKPEPTGQAEMLEGTPEEIATRMTEILAEEGLV